MASDPDGLRKLSDHDLYVWTGGWKAGTQNHLKGQAEIKRRHQKGAGIRSWSAIGISAFALAVALVALFTR